MVLLNPSSQHAHGQSKASHSPAACLVQVCGALQCWRDQDALRPGPEALLLVLARGQQHQVSCWVLRAPESEWLTEDPTWPMPVAHRVPVSGVAVKINGKWLDLKRSWTNSWPYHRVRVRLSWDAASWATICYAHQPAAGPAGVRKLARVSAHVSRSLCMRRLFALLNNRLLCAGRSFPMPIRVTSVLNETVEDVIEST